MKQDREMRLQSNPKFKLPKVKFSPKYFNRRMREVRRSLPSGGKV